MIAIDLTNGEMRRRLPEIARAIKDPDEIWAFWDVEKKELFRFYYVRFADAKTHPYVICRTDKTGWIPDRSGFATDERISQMRQGTLVYRRADHAS